MRNSTEANLSQINSFMCINMCKYLISHTLFLSLIHLFYVESLGTEGVVFLTLNRYMLHIF